MPEYKNGKIYMIWFEGDDRRYYGSTTNSLHERFSQHKLHYKHKNSTCSLFQLFDLYGVDKAKIELVEAYPCENRNELRRQEGFHIRNNTHINIQIAGNTKSESDKLYKKNHNEECKARDKAYYQRNKEKIKERRALYYEEHKETEKQKMKERYHSKKDSSV
jgi:hypothetical protein